MGGWADGPIEEQMCVCVCVCVCALHDPQGPEGDELSTTRFHFVFISIDPNALMPLDLASGEGKVL